MSTTTTSVASEGPKLSTCSVYVTVSPSTGSVRRSWTFVIDRSACGTRRTPVSPVLLSGFGSAVCADTTAVFTNEPVAPGRTRARTVAVIFCPTATVVVPAEHLTACPSMEQSPATELMEMGSNVSGRTSSTVTPTAWDGPTFVASMSNVMISPGTALSGPDLVVWISATGSPTTTSTESESFVVSGSGVLEMVLARFVRISPPASRESSRPTTVTWTDSPGSRASTTQRTSASATVQVPADVVGSPSMVTPLGRVSKI